MWAENKTHIYSDTHRTSWVPPQVTPSTESGVARTLTPPNKAKASPSPVCEEAQASSALPSKCSLSTAERRASLGGLARFRESTPPCTALRTRQAGGCRAGFGDPIPGSQGREFPGESGQAAFTLEGGSTVPSPSIWSLAHHRNRPALPRRPPPPQFGEEME